MIRQQQTQIQALQSTSHGSSAVVDDSTPPTPQAAVRTSSGSRSRSPFIPHSLSRNPSYRSNRSSTANSPSIIPLSGVNDGNELHLGPSATRDESAFYQAETQTLTRENQMLKLRIRELGQCLLTCWYCTELTIHRATTPRYKSYISHYTLASGCVALGSAAHHPNI